MYFSIFGAISKIIVTTDQQIISTLKKDKQRGFKLLFDRYYRPMCVFGAKYIDSIDVVEDLVQDIFMNIWDSIDHSNVNNLKSYLFTSVRNRSLTYLKKKQPDHLEEINYDWQKDLYIQEDDEEEVARKIQEVKKAIAELPKGCQDVFNAVVIGGLKYQEAADELGVSINTIKSQLKKSYRLLNDKLHLVVLLLLIGN